MTMFLAPYTAIADIDGSPLDAGFLFFGKYGKDPELFPVEVFWDADFTVPAAQPIRTRNGYPVRNGSPTKVYLKTAQHSIVIKNRNSAFILVDFNNKGWDASFVVDGDENQKQINSKTVKTVNSIADLIALKNPGNGSLYQVISRDAPNYALLTPFAGGGIFQYNASSTATVNDGTVFAGEYGGRYLRIYDGDVCVSWFAGHGWTGEDKTARVQQAINFTNKTENALALKVDGKYTITSSLIIDRMVDTTKGDYVIYADGNNNGFRIDTPITMFSSSIPSDFSAAGYTRHPVSEFVTFCGLDFEATVAHVDNCVFDDKFLRINFDNCTHRKIRGCKSAQYLQSIAYTGVNKFRQHVGYFIEVSSGYDLRFNGMQFENSADGFKFTGNVFGGYFDGNLFQGSGQFLRVNAMAGGSISKNYFEANADQEIIFTGAGNGVSIDSNLFYTAPAFAPDVNFYHIQLGSSFGVSLRGNRALHNLADNSNTKVFTISESGNRVEAGRKVLKIDINSIAQVTPTASGTQASSLPIKNLSNAIYTDVTGGGLLLPELGEMGSNTVIRIINNSNVPVNVFPASGERVLGGAYDVAYQVTGYGKVVDFHKSDSDFWVAV